MSLISPKHFVSPVRNTTHLVSIIAIVLLFTLFRWLGGGISISERSTSSQDLSFSEKVEDSPISEPETQKARYDITDSKKNKTIEEDTESLPTAKPGTGRKSQLDEVEEAMGLR